MEKQQMIEKIHARMDGLIADEKRAWANLNAILGAIQENEYYLTMLHEEDKSNNPTVYEGVDNVETK